MGLNEVDPSTAEYQVLAEAPLVNGEPSNPPVPGISPIKVSSYAVIKLHFQSFQRTIILTVRCGNDFL